MTEQLHLYSDQCGCGWCVAVRGYHTRITEILHSLEDRDRSLAAICKREIELSERVSSLTSTIEGLISTGRECANDYEYGEYGYYYWVRKALAETTRQDVTNKKQPEPVIDKQHSVRARCGCRINGPAGCIMECPHGNIVQAAQAADTQSRIDGDLSATAYNDVQDRERPVKQAESDKLQRLYDNEINFEVSCFWDGGIRWGLGDYSNGFTAEGNEPTVAAAIDELYCAAEAKYKRLKTPGEDTHG